MEYNVNEIVNHINSTGICVLEDYFTSPSVAVSLPPNT